MNLPCFTTLWGASIFVPALQEGTLEQREVKQLALVMQAVSSGGVSGNQTDLVNVCVFITVAF